MSRHNPQHNKDNLSAALPKAGVEYVWMGEGLGGFRKEGYDAYSHSAAFAAAIGRLAEIACQKTVAVMCAEKLFWKCHRRWIASALSERGFHVVHILDEKRTMDALPKGAVAGKPICQKLLEKGKNPSRVGLPR